MEPSPVSPKNTSGLARFIIVCAACVCFIFFFFSALGCGSNGCNTGRFVYISTAQPTPMVVDAQAYTLNARPSYKAGDRIELQIGGAITSGVANLTWTPPPLASDFIFQPGKSPAPGGPPFIFSGLSKTDLETGIPVSYIAHYYGIPSIQDMVLLAQGAQQSTAYLTHNMTEALAEPLPDSGEAAAGLPAVLPAEPAATESVVWQISNGVEINEAFNTTVCQQIIDEGKSANNFTAWQLPVATQTQPDIAYQIPVYSDEFTTPQLTIMAGVQYIRASLEVRHDTTIWANNHLPEQEGRIWVSMGIPATSTATCPADISGTSYAINTFLPLNLGSQENNCLNCVITSYNCFNTGSGLEQMIRAQALQAFFPGQQAVSSGDGITCVGPNTTRLISPQSNWDFNPETNTLDGNSPGATLDAVYAITNKDLATQTFSLSSSSTLPGATWTLYYGMSGNEEAEPDYSAPVGAQLVAPEGLGGFGFPVYLHLVASMPASVAAGQYTVTLSASGATADPAAISGDVLILVNLPSTLSPAAYDVAMAGGAVKSEIAPGSPATFTLTVINPGDFQLDDLVVTDTLPVDTTFTACSGGDSCAYSTATGKITWYLDYLGTGLSHTFNLTVQPSPALQPNSQISNVTYTVTTGNGVADSGDLVRITLALLKVFMPLMVIRQ